MGVIQKYIYVLFNFVHILPEISDVSFMIAECLCLYLAALHCSIVRTRATNEHRSFRVILRKWYKLYIFLRLEVQYLMLTFKIIDRNLHLSYILIYLDLLKC